MHTGANIQYKKPHEGECGFAFENGKRVAVTDCDAEGADFTELFEDALLEAGFDLAKAALASRIAEEFFAKFCNVRASDAVREILLKIADTKTGRSPEYRALLAIFSPGRMLEDVAGEVGLSRQSVGYHLEKLRPFFALPPT